MGEVIYVDFVALKNRKQNKKPTSVEDAHAKLMRMQSSIDRINGLIRELKSGSSVESVSSEELDNLLDRR